MKKVNANKFYDHYVNQNYKPGQSFTFNEFLGELFSPGINHCHPEIKIPNYEHISENEHGERKCEDCWGIIKYKNAYYKAEWLYSSYNGYNFDYIHKTITEVKPKEVTVLKFEEI